jgi:hypothetical protein
VLVAHRHRVQHDENMAGNEAKARSFCRKAIDPFREKIQLEYACSWMQNHAMFL